MKIAIVSESDGKAGGSATAYRLHKALRSAKQDSAMIVATATRHDASVDGPHTLFGRTWSKIAKNLDSLPARYFFYPDTKISPGWVPENTTRRVNSQEPDIVNLHWINHGFLRPESFCNFRAPIVWTLHDMWAFAGAEHYVGNSRRYIDGYLPSNRTAEESGWDLNRWVWRRKQKAWHGLQDKVTLLSPSHWLRDCARRSVLFRDYRIEVIPNGIDTQRFHPIDRSIARGILGLPLDKKIILFGAINGRANRIKGFDLFQGAMDVIQHDLSMSGIEIAVFGATEPSAGPDFGLKSYYLGQLNDEISMALVYAAADVFVIPSREENLATTVLEALACGTPVVGFRVGGTPDMVIDGENGFLAEPNNVADMAACIKAVLTGNSEAMSRAASSTIVEKFTLAHQVTRYMTLFEDVLSRGRKN